MTLGALVWLLASLLITACGSSGSGEVVLRAVEPAPPPVEPAPAPPPPAPPPLEGWHGHFSGVTWDPSGDHYSEALLTTDGAVRIVIGNTDDPAGSAQFVGQIDSDQQRWHGMVIGQDCATVHVSRLCNANAFGTLRMTLALLTGIPPNLRGELEVTVNGETEIWRLDMESVGTYRTPARLASAEGVYGNWWGSVGFGSDMVMSVDSVGQIALQSALAGCVGNGTLATHPDGRFNVYDITLTVASCSAQFAGLNATFAGLATRTTYYDEYITGGQDDLLILWLSTMDGAVSPAAVTIWGVRL